MADLFHKLAVKLKKEGHQRYMNKNKKYHCGLLFVAVIALFGLTSVSASDNFVKVSLPKGVSIELPKDWIVLSEDQRIAIDTIAESGLDLAGIEHKNLDMPFSANYYKNGKTVGIIQIRYYQNIDLTQNDSRQATPQDITEMNSILKESSVKSMTAVDEVSGLSWTEKTTINGITAFVTEYHRKTGEFRVHLIRVFAGKRTFTLTVAYLEEELFSLEPNINRIINSLKLSGIIEEDLDSSVAGNKDASAMRDWFFGFAAVFYVLLRAVQGGYRQWKECIKVGYNPIHYEKTGKMIPFYGGYKEGIPSVVFGALGLIIIPGFFHIKTAFELAIGYVGWRLWP